MHGKTRSNSRRQLLSGYLFFILALTCSLDVNAQRQKSYFVSSGLMINQIVVPVFAEYSDYIKISPSLGTSIGIGKNVTKKGKFYTSLSVGIESPRIPDGMTAYDLTDRIQEIDDRLTPTRFYYLTTLNNTISTNYSVPYFVMEKGIISKLSSHKIYTGFTFKYQYMGDWIISEYNTGLFTEGIGYEFELNQNSPLVLGINSSLKYKKSEIELQLMHYNQDITHQFYNRPGSFGNLNLQDRYRNVNWVISVQFKYHIHTKNEH